MNFVLVVWAVALTSGAIVGTVGVLILNRDRKESK